MSPSWVCCIVCVCVRARVSYQAYRGMAVHLLCVLLLLSWALCAECPVASVVSDNYCAMIITLGVGFLDITPVTCVRVAFKMLIWCNACPESQFEIISRSLVCSWNYCCENGKKQSHFFSPSFSIPHKVLYTNRLALCCPLFFSTILISFPRSPSSGVVVFRCLCPPNQ